MSKNANGLLWLAAVAANLAVALWFSWALMTLTDGHHDNAELWSDALAGVVFIGIPVLSVVALWTFRPRSDSV